MKYANVERRPGSQAKVKEALEKAITEKKAVNLWLDMRGELVTMTFEPQSGGGDVFLAAQESTSAPSFPVCIAVRGRLLNQDGNPMSIEDLAKAIKAAEAKRDRFYTEREKRFGPSASPDKAA